MPEDLSAFLADRLGLLIAEANEAGHGTMEVLDELERHLKLQRRAYQEDPDPADEPDIASA